MEEFVKLVLDRLHHARARVPVHIMVIAVTIMCMVRLAMPAADVVIRNMRKLEVTPVRVLGPVRVHVVVPVVGFPFMMPIIGSVLDSVGVVMLIHMLGVMLTIVKVRVIVAKVMVTFWFDVMVLTVLFSSEMSLVVKMRYMVLQLPITLLEVSIWVVFVTMDKLSHVWSIMLVNILIRSHLVIDVILGRKVLSAVLLLLFLARLLALLGLALGLSLLLALLFVHLFVEEGGLRSQMLLSLGLSLRWLGMVIWIVVVWIRVVIVAGGLVRVLIVVVWCLRVVELLSVWVGMHRILIIILSMSCIWARVVRCIWINWTVGRIAVRIVCIRFTSMHFPLHVTVMLFGTHVVVLVSLLTLFTLWHFVFRSRFSPDCFVMRRLESAHAMALFNKIRLHLKYQIAVLDVSLGGSEGCAVCIKGSIVRLVPPVSVKGVEAIPPVEVERLRRVVVRVRLHIVVHNIPGHILGI